MGLTAKQLDALGQIALGNDGGHHPKTLKALQERGLIERHAVRAVGERLPFYDIHYSVPIPIHMQWCAWCDAQPEVTA